MDGSDRPVSNELVLVRLDGEQIAFAGRANPHRRKITHGLLCGKYGQMFGTEKQCRKYYDAWRDIFRGLFDAAYEAGSHPIHDYRSTADVVMLLIEDQDRMDLHPHARSARWP